MCDNVHVIVFNNWDSFNFVMFYYSDVPVACSSVSALTTPIDKLE